MGVKQKMKSLKFGEKYIFHSSNPESELYKYNNTEAVLKACNCDIYIVRFWDGEYGYVTEDQLKQLSSGYNKLNFYEESLIFEKEDWTEEEFKTICKIFSCPENTDRIKVECSSVEYYTK